MKPHYFEAHAERSNVYRALNNQEEALVDIEHSMEIKPNVNATIIKARILLEMGKLREADMKLDLAQRFHLKDSLSFSQKASNLAKGSKTAEQWFEEGVKHYYIDINKTEALKCFSTAIAIKFDYAEAYAERGNVLRALNKPQEALIEAERSIAIKPNANAIYIKARVLLQLDKEKIAETYFNIGQGLKEQDSLGFYHKASVLFYLGRIEEAIACYTKAIEMSPTYTLLYYLKGNAVSTLGNKQEAIACFDQYIRMNPTDPAAHFKKSAALAQIGQREEAIASYDKGGELDFDDPDCYNSRNLALSLLGKKEEAKLYYDKAVILNKRDEVKSGKNSYQVVKLCSVHINDVNKCYSCTKSKMEDYDYEEAILYSTRALKLNTNQGKALENKEIGVAILKKTSK